MPEIKGGDGLDMAQLMDLFASKNPPDNTIKRIEALEADMAKVKDKLGRMGTGGPAVSSGLDEDAMDKLNDLLRRVQSLETRADKTDRQMGDHEGKLQNHEQRITVLEAKDFTPAVSASGEIDTSAILQQLNLVKAEVNNMRNDFNNYQTKMQQDLDALRLEMRNYTDAETDSLKKQAMKKIDEV